MNTVGYDKSDRRNLELDGSSLANGVSKSESGVRAHCSKPGIGGRAPSSVLFSFLFRCDLLELISMYMFSFLNI
jgi:hypothetical protein